MFSSPDLEKARHHTKPTTRFLFGGSFAEQRPLPARRAVRHFMPRSLNHDKDPLVNQDSSPLMSLREFGVHTTDGLETSPISAELRPSETLLIVGAMNAGKSLIFEHLANIERPGVGSFGERRGDAVLVPQDPRLSALPTDNVWSLLQLERIRFLTRKTIGFRGTGSPREARADELLSKLGLRLSRLFDRPFSSLSGGERRRLLCVAALLDPPKTLLIDGWEEYSDPVLRRHLVEVLGRELRRGMSLVVSARHYPPLDLSFDRALQIVRPDSTAEVTALPLVAPAVRSSAEFPLLSVEDLVVEKRRLTWPQRSRPAYPVDGATLSIFPGETLCILGPSGCGKSTLLHSIAGLFPVSHGSIQLENRNVTHVRGRRARRVRRDVQLVFQEAAPVLDPDKTVMAHLREAAQLGKIKDADFERALRLLNLPKRLLEMPSDQLSSSESQRIDLARSLILRPKLILWDEPAASAADTDGGGLAAALKQEKTMGRAFVVTTASPQVAEALADRIAVMYAGRIIEVGTADEVLNHAAHPLTLAYLAGEGVGPSDPFEPSSGCPHTANCPYQKFPTCSETEPKLRELISSAGRTSSRRRVSCFFPVGHAAAERREAPPPELGE